MPEEYDIGIIVPLTEEFRVLQECFPISGREFADAINYYSLRLPQTSLRVVAVVLGDMGKSPAAHITERLLAHAKPAIVALIGIAGALDSEIRLGDVAVASEVNEFQAASKAVQREGTFALKYSGNHWKTDFALTRCASEFEFTDPSLYHTWQRQARNHRVGLALSFGKSPLTRDSPTVAVGHIASGDTVVASQTFAVELLGIDRKFLAIEMEAAGVAQAASGRESPVRTLICRGISDFADDRKKKLDLIKGGAWREYAMYNASTFLANLLRASSVQKIIASSKSTSTSPILGVPAVLARLEQHFSRWTGVSGSYLPRLPSWEEAAMIISYADEIASALDERRLAFMLAIAIWHGLDFIYWGQMNKDNEEVVPILLELLERPERRPGWRVGLVLEQLSPTLRNEVATLAKQRLLNDERAELVFTKAAMNETLDFWESELPEFLDPKLADELVQQAKASRRMSDAP